MVYEIHFKQTWRKEIKDQLTRMDSMWTSDYISWRALQVSIIEKNYQRNLDYFIQIQFDLPCQQLLLVLEREAEPPVKSMIIYKWLEASYISWTTLDIVQSSWTQLSSKAVKKR